MGIKKIHEWEKAVVFLLNLDGWELELTKTTDKAMFISTPTHPQCNDGFWIPKSVCLFEYVNHWSDNCLVRVIIGVPYSLTAQGKDEAKNGGFSAAHAIANFATKNRTDVYCNA